MKILLAGGGTGGHLYPGIALVSELRELDPACEIMFIGTRGGLEEQLVPEAGHQLRLIAAGRGSPLSLSRPANLPRFIIALLQSIMVLREFRPDVVVALGGYAAGAPGLAARICTFPLVLLEQNVVPGRVTRWLSGWAEEAYLQFGEAKKALSGVPCFVTGSPLRQEVMSISPDGKRDSLLIMGGSQGARQLNRIACEAMRKIVADTGCKVIHLAGREETATVRGALEGVDVEIHAFCNDMAACYRRARLAVSRAGAMSIAELAVAGLPAVLVPLPGASDDHQRENAKAVAEGTVMLEQETLTPELLTGTVCKLWQDESRLKAMSSAMKEFSRPDAGKDIAQRIRTLVAGKVL